MKRLILLSALLILACSSDDSTSDDNNQLFLEKYDGIVWERDNSFGERRYTFTNNPKGLISYFWELEGATDESCAVIEFGEPYINDEGENEGIMILLEENENSIVLSFDENDPDEVATFTVTTSENTLVITYPPDDSGDDSPTLTRNEDILPCY